MDIVSVEGALVKGGELGLGGALQLGGAFHVAECFVRDGTHFGLVVR